MVRGQVVAYLERLQLIQVNDDIFLIFFSQINKKIDRFGIPEAYFDAAAKILHKSGSSNCTNAIADAFRQIQQMVSAGNEERLQALFNVCSTSTLNLNNPQNVQLFYGMLIGSIPSTINTL